MYLRINSSCDFCWGHLPPCHFIRWSSHQHIHHTWFCFIFLAHPQPPCEQCNNLWVNAYKCVHSLPRLCLVQRAQKWWKSSISTMRNELLSLAAPRTWRRLMLLPAAPVLLSPAIENSTSRPTAHSPLFNCLWKMCLVGSSRGKTTTCGSPCQEWGLLAACPDAPSRMEWNSMGLVRATSMDCRSLACPWILGVSFGLWPCRFLAKILLFGLWVPRRKFISNIQETLERGIENTIGWFLFPSQRFKKKTKTISPFKCCCWGCKLPSSQEHNVLSLLLALHWQLMALFAQPRQALEQQ